MIKFYQIEEEKEKNKKENYYNDRGVVPKILKGINY